MKVDHEPKGQTTEIKVNTVVEKHFYWMPDTLEMTLAALTAIQDFHSWMSKGYSNVNEPIQTRREAEITLCIKKEMEFLKGAFENEGLTKVVNIIQNAMSQDLRDYDLTVQFDPARARRLSEVAQKSAAQGFGIMTGGDPVKATPILTNCNPPEPTRDILILPFPDQMQLISFLELNKPELTTSHYMGDFNEQEHDPWELICDHKMVIGLRSGLTYLAASLGKAVVEIYPPDEYRDWLSKWSCPLYQMIYSKPEEVSAALVYRAVEVLWKRLVLHRTTIEASTPTEPSQLNVDIAENRSLE